MKKITWLWTALVTPFKQWNGIDNEVDYEALDRLLDMQIDWWVDGVLFLWTTAENPTLSQTEWKSIVEFGIKKLAWKAKIMVNIWNYSTKESIETAHLYDQIDGIDAYLVVNPYYSKPTQTWLLKHFTTIADSTSRDIVLYNILWRTWVNLETDTLVKIVNSCSNVVAVKEASGDLDQMKEVITATWDDFSVLSWDDGLTYDLIQNWWDGVISVASNCVPAKMRDLVKASLGKDKIAEELHIDLQELFSKLFMQTNPLPAKTYLASKWIIQETFRLPICEMDEKERGEFLNFVEKSSF